MTPTTFRWIRLAAVALATAACGRPDSHAGTATGRARPDSAAGSVAQADTTRGSLPANHLGRIPVVEYHVIGGDKNALYTRTVESFEADLDDIYRRGYRPITVAQMLDKDWSDVPAGMSPV